MKTNLNEIDTFFLKMVKEEMLPQYNLPIGCISIELKEESFLLYYIMQQIPVEVFLNRYEIIDEFAQECKMILKSLNARKLHEMKVFIDYRDKKKNLLYQI